MRLRGHIFARLATAWWLVVCLMAPHVAAMMPAQGEGHSCCRRKSDCCCRNRTGKRSAMIGDRAECSRTCGMPSLGAVLEAGIAAGRETIQLVAAQLRIPIVVACLGMCPLEEVLHQRPPPSK
jgi:hypothetical protein